MRCVTRYLVRWRGHTSADDEWPRLEELAHCPEKVVPVTVGTTPRPPPPSRPGPPDRAGRRARTCSSRAPPALSPLVLPAGFRLATRTPSEVVTGPALVGRPVLFYWPTDEATAAMLVPQA